MTRLALVDKRTFPRIAPTVLRVGVEQDGERREAYVLNISLGGAFLVLFDPPAPEENAALEIVLPWGLGECHIEATAVWNQKDENGRSIGAGLAFDTVAEEDKQKLQRYLDHFVALTEEITA
ncbi:MAG TPA: PilZ domain-containing protein [Vicinamibacteria bacterium]|nr:PilZ domain-containing protein [Vicinamibacteria bacterium]